MELNIFHVLSECQEIRSGTKLTATCKHTNTHAHVQTQYVWAYTLRSEHDLIPWYAHIIFVMKCVSLFLCHFWISSEHGGKQAKASSSYGHKQIRPWFRRAYPLFHMDSVISAAASLDINLSVSGGCRCCRKASSFPFCFRKHSAASHNRREETTAVGWM